MSVSKLLMKRCVLSLALTFSALAYAGEVQVSRNGYSLQVEQQGQGPAAVVFESGFGQGADAWKEVIAASGR